MGRVTNQKIDTINMHVNKYLMFHASSSRLTKMVSIAGMKTISDHLESDSHANCL